MKILIFTLGMLLAASASFAEVSRPPQYVLFAFDGSYSLPMWRETQEYARQMTANGMPIKFTYFINSAYYLSSSYRTNYVAPHLGARGAGKSAIGFGGSVENVRTRYDETNKAFRGGHEIANHAAGHFDGSKWSYNEWKYEFQQFFSMLFDRFLINNRTSYTMLFPNGWAFGKSEFVGFRAPQLGQNAAMYQVLQGYGVRYDTSKTAEPSYWPTKSAQGIWNFPLGEIRIAGTGGKKTLSMDYNFYYYQSGGKENPSSGRAYEEQMYQSYVAYFQGNYNGNRAPVNIGHHFSLWNGGAYWRAMKRLAQKVCGMPEVKCVTYKEYMNYLESLDVPTLDSYKRGLFPRGRAVQLASADSDWMTYQNMIHRVGGHEPSPAELLMADPAEAHDEDLRAGQDERVLRAPVPVRDLDSVEI